MTDFNIEDEIELIKKKMTEYFEKTDRPLDVKIELTTIYDAQFNFGDRIGPRFHGIEDSVTFSRENQYAAFLRQNKCW